MSSTTTDNKPRWFHPTPARLLIVLLVIEAILLLSKPWFPKGYAVLTAIASVGVMMVLMLIWWAAALLFHWRFQFSLRSLLVATVAIAIPFSWLAVEMKKAREQMEAVEAIQEEMEGMALYGANANPLTSLQTDRLLGFEFFEDVVDVELERKQLTHAGLKHLAVLSRIRKLNLTGTNVADEDLIHLKGLVQLEDLYLDSTGVTDAGLAYLEGLNHLRWLGLLETKITHQGVKKLQRALPNCYILH
ncbi:MAG: hypothetical protein WCB27_00200 [Thermoguttaceae bacterium]